MKKTNKVFLFVVSLLIGVIAITWQFIQTERFGALLNKRISSELSKRYGVTASFQRFEIGVFPLATRIVNLELEYEDYYITAGKLGLEFGLRDIFSDDFSIGNVALSDAIIYLPKFEKNEEGPVEWKKFFNIYEEKLVKKLPFELRGVALRNSIVTTTDFEVQVVEGSVNFFPNLLVSNFSLVFEPKIFEALNSSELKNLNLNGASGQIQLSRDNIRFKKLKLMAQNSFVEVTGKFLTNDQLQSVKLSSFLDMKKVRKIIPSDKVNLELIPLGSVSLTGLIDGPYNNPKGNFKIKGTNIRSPFYKFGALGAELELSDENLKIINAQGWQRSGYLKVTESLDIYNFAKKEIIYPTAFMEAKDISTNEIFFFLPKLSRAKAYISGPFRLKITKNDMTLKTFEGFGLKNFALMGESEKKILVNPQVFMAAGSNINVQFKGDVNFDTGLTFPGSSLSLKGTVKKEGVDVQMQSGSVVDLKEFGPISGLELEGTGPVEGTIKGPFDDVGFAFNLSPNDFKMLGFSLGQISGMINYSLKDSFLQLIGLNGSYKGLEYQGGGSIDFKSEKEALDMKFKIKKASLKDSSVALKPIFDPLMKYLKHTSFNYQASISMRGGLKVPLMRVNGKMTASNILIFAEDIESMKGNFSLNQNKLKFTELKFKKVSGSLNGEGEYDLNDGSYSYRGTLANLRVKDIFYYRLLNLGLDGDAYGEFYGVGDRKVFSSRSHVRLTNSSIENVRLNDSILTVYNNKDDLFFTTSAIGGELKGEGYINLSGKKNKKSALSFNLDSPNLRELAGVLGKHNILNQAIRGQIKASLRTDFYIEDFSNVNLVATLDKARFSYPGVRIDRLERPLKVELENSEFKSWNYKIKGDGFYLESEGSGNLNSKFSLKHKYSLNSSLAELLTENIEKAQGVVEGDHLLVGNIKNLNQFLKLKGDGLSFKARAMPGLFSDFSFFVLLEDNVLVVKKATGTYGNGKIASKGTVKFKFPFPEVDLSVGVEKSRFPILKKSGVVVSGELGLKGKSLPYDLTGALAIIQGEVIDEMNDLASSAINSESYQRFIPVGYLEGNVSFINTDIALNSFSPIQIKNGMIDLGLGGSLKIFGSIFSPKFNGELLIENPENKFLFKGHEFVLSEGLVRFIDGARKESPELRFSGVARINDYDVYINLNGPADNMNVEMTSNPPLSQEDILSLLTLGVTSDVSRNLGDRQRQSVTTLSIGSLIMDQLKINQSLNDSLGVRLSIQPEFIEDENNLLEGRTDDRAGGNRFRSSTVLKVQKRVSKKVNLSLSSTVGGSVDQSQEMNINYKINKSWSLEGVYEVRSNDELEQELPDSIGADVKYQWSF